MGDTHEAMRAEVMQARMICSPLGVDLPMIERKNVPVE
jgi:hypothetical protein